MLAGPSEFQSRVAGGLGQGGDAAMVLVASAVEANLVNAGLLGPLGHDAADYGGGRLVAAVLDLGLDVGLHGAGRDQRRPGLVIDHLGVDVLRAAEDRQAGTFGRPREPIADVPLAPEPPRLHEPMLVCYVHGTILNWAERLLRAECLTGLATDDL